MHTLRFAMMNVWIHFALAGLHGAAHLTLGVPLSTLQWVFVTAVIAAAPVLAWTQLRRGEVRRGGALLVLALGASFVFGFYNHYFSATADNVAHVPGGALGHLFVTTAALVAVTEAAGTLAGCLLWVRPSAARTTA